MSKTETAEPETETIVAATTIFVQTTIKLGSGKEADESTEGESRVIEVHKFATEPASVEAGLSIRKSQQTANGDWVAGELTIRVTRRCYNEEIPAARKRAYLDVKDGIGEDLPKMLDALNKLSTR